MLHPSKSVELSRKIPFPTITNPEQIKWVKKCVNEELIEEAKIKGWRYRPENDCNFCQHFKKDEVKSNLRTQQHILSFERKSVDEIGFKKSVDKILHNRVTFRLPTINRSVTVKLKGLNECRNYNKIYQDSKLSKQKRQKLNKQENRKKQKNLRRKSINHEQYNQFLEQMRERYRPSTERFFFKSSFDHQYDQQNKKLYVKAVTHQGFLEFMKNKRRSYIQRING